MEPGGGEARPGTPLGASLASLRSGNARAGARAAARELAASLRDPRLYVTALVAAALGMAGAIVTVGFIKALERLQTLLFDDLPDAIGVAADGLGFLLVTCAVGGALVGLARRALGEYPRGLEESLEDFERDRGFDYRHIPQAIVMSLLSLGFGAALGPEAALVAIVGGLGTLVGKYVTASATGQRSLTYLGIAGALGGIFNTPGAAALPVDDTYVLRRPGRIWMLLPGLVAAGASAWVFARLFSGDGYFDYDYPAYDFAAVDLAWAALVAVAGTALALAFVVCGRVTDRLAAPLRAHPVAQSFCGGVALGLLGAATTLVLFSGHTGIQTVIDDVDASAGFLLGVCAAKVLAANVCLSTGWKGGRFFPILFAGAALGLALSHALSSLPATVALAAAMTAAVGGLVRKPVAAALLMVLLFPADVVPAVVVAAAVSAPLAALVTRAAARGGEAARAPSEEATVRRS